MAAPGDDRLIGRSLAGGRVEILSLLGEGSIGAVYRARHAGLGSIVAVKVLHEAFQRDAEFCRRFHQEALAMSRLDHPNLIHICDFGQEPDGLLYISIAYVDGITLRELLQRERRLDLPRIVGLMLQVCGGLGHAHSRGLIHRDVKPDNLMIVTKTDDDGAPVEVVKILDYGFAVPPSGSGEVAQRLAGTPVYMSPEQCRGEAVDERSDIYSCGIMMYELATGTVPFLSHDIAAIQRMHMTSPPPLIAAKRAAIDPRYERIVQRALSKSREQRFASMTELRAELKALLGPERASAIDLHEARASSPPVAPAISSRPSAQSVAPQPRTDAQQSAPPMAPPTRTSVMPPPPSGAPPSWPSPAIRPSTIPAWIESSATGYARLIDEAAAPLSNTVADALARDASSWLGGLARERDQRALIRRLEELDDAVRVLAQRADAKTLQRVSVVVAGLRDRGSHEATGTALAAIARQFTDPETLTPIATRLLEQPEDPAAAVELITRARLAGAIALYGARLRLLADARERASVPPSSGSVERPAQRGRVVFVTTMKSLGTSAMPVLRPALERIRAQAATGLDRPLAELAEDVLLSVPKLDDEATGALVVGFAGWNVPTVCRAAARALPRVWGERARSFLIGLVQHPDDSVCLAAIAGLHEMDAIDLAVVASIAAQIDAGRARKEQVRAAFAAALRSATASAHVEALNVLARLTR